MNEEFILNEETYYSAEANKRWMSVHQFLSFAGGLLSHGCEERAMKELSGEWSEPTSDAMVVGSFVDAFFDNTLDKFKEEHPECFTQKGELKAAYKRAEKMIERCTQDEYFMKFMGGQKQVIMTGFWAGCDWKIKMDSFIPGKLICDLKTSQDIRKTWRVEGGYATFIEAFNYDKQLALYQKIVEINTGEKLPCYIAVVTKEEYPDIEIIEIDQPTLDFALEQIKENIDNVLAVKDGEVVPSRCGHCNYCKSTKKLMKPINYRDLINTEI